MTAPRPDQPQDAYCRDCAHFDTCNVMLKDGEACGDRHADPTPCLECDGLPSECRPCGCPHVEQAPEDFDAQVRECLAHWPGIEAIDLDA